MVSGSIRPELLPAVPEHHRRQSLEQIHQAVSAGGARRLVDPDEKPAMLRSAARRGSDKSWKMQDPQLPKSIWYHTDAQFLGFRVVRPFKVPSEEELSKYWTSGVEKE